VNKWPDFNARLIQFRYFGGGLVSLIADTDKQAPRKYST